MTEVEKRENEALKKCLKEAYGYSDEQLRKEMEEAEQSLNDSDFPGAEERIYQKIMEREAAEKKAANTGAGTNAPDRKKAVRLGKKRVFLVAILAAAFVGLLGLTAVGEKSYFFRMREAARKMEEKHFSNHATHVEFLPVEWRSKLTLDGGIFCLKLNEFSQ